MNKHDIQSKADVELLVTSFYKKVIPDSVIGFFFTEVVTLSWEDHIPVMVGFWEHVLLGSPTYQGNPMDKHFALNKLSPMKPEHFQRWLTLWKETVEENFSGPVAENAISRAVSISGIMEHKICH
jgi:hemoglobin